MAIHKELKETTISEFYSDDFSRKAMISEDKYHYICRLYNVTDHGVLSPYKTVLISDHSLSYCEDLCENFVNRIGSFA